MLLLFELTLLVVFFFCSCYSEQPLHFGLQSAKQSKVKSVANINIFCFFAVFVKNIVW